MKYLVQTNNITEEKSKIVDWDRVIVDTTDNSVYTIKGDGYNLIDLGLPSGTLWMDRNIGAKKIEDYGLYFAWGETQGYTADEVGKTKQFSWADYKYANGDEDKLTKYCSASSFGNEGYTDNLTELELSDDAAYAYTNGKCNMPTYEQIHELDDFTDMIFTTKDNVEGTLVVSKVNNNTMFLPHTGVYYNGTQHKGFKGYSMHWSTYFTRDKTNNIYGWLLRTDKSINNNALVIDSGCDEYDRCFGCSIRGVKI